MMRLHGVFATLATLTVTLAVAYGFFLVGSPGTRRSERFDEQRLSDLQTIVREAGLLCLTEKDGERVLKSPAPKSLDALAAAARDSRVPIRDPETGEPYQYEFIDEKTIKVCAEFTFPRDSDQSVFWNHTAGKQCFTINLLDPPPLY